MNFISAQQPLNNKAAREIYLVQHAKKIKKIKKSIILYSDPDGTLRGAIGSTGHSILFTDNEEVVFVREENKSSVFKSLEEFIIYYLATFW